MRSDDDGKDRKVSTVISRHNEQDLGRIGAFFARRGLAWAPKTMGYYMGSKLNEAAMAQIIELVPKHQAYRGRFAIRDGRLVSLLRRCPYHEPCISVDGDVSVCCHDMLFENKTVNVLEVGSLKAALASPEFVAARKLGDQMKLPICQGCN